MLYPTLESWAVCIKKITVCRFPQLANALTSFSSSTSGTENRPLSVRLTFSPWFYTLPTPSLPLRYWPLLHHWLSPYYPFWHLHLNMPVILSPDENPLILISSLPVRLLKVAYIEFWLFTNHPSETLPEKQLFAAKCKEPFSVPISLLQAARHLSESIPLWAWFLDFTLSSCPAGFLLSFLHAAASTHLSKAVIPKVLSSAPFSVFLIFILTSLTHWGLPILYL